MKTFLTIALVLTTGVAALFLWGSGHARGMASASSQIFIHGTPVCVTQRGGEIEAAVGDCGVLAGGPQKDSGGYGGGNLPPGHPRLGLPPGHPPIDAGPGTGDDGRRRTLI